MGLYSPLQSSQKTVGGGGQPISWKGTLRPQTGGNALTWGSREGVIWDTSDRDKGFLPGYLLQARFPPCKNQTIRRALFSA